MCIDHLRYMNVVIVGSSTLVAGNIKNGVTIFGVTGNCAGIGDSSIVILDGSWVRYGILCSWLTWYDGSVGGWKLDANSTSDPLKQGKLVIGPEYTAYDNHYYYRVTYQEQYLGGYNPYMEVSLAYNQSTSFEDQWATAWGKLYKLDKTGATITKDYDPWDSFGSTSSIYTGRNYAFQIRNNAYFTGTYFFIKRVEMIKA